MKEQRKEEIKWGKMRNTNQKNVVNVLCNITLKAESFKKK
jgi:hypothetical protein